MAASSTPPKGILKNSADSKAAPKSARDIAIHHATILQHRKDIESEILESVILLSTYPLDRAPAYSAASPAPSDVAGFKSNIRLFQPSDYDDLVEERNANGLCGYTLCAKPRRNAGPGGEWKITAGGEIVKRRELEMWCSQMCAKRAMYVKVQLNETGAWERAAIEDIKIDLYGEVAVEETETDRTARKLGDLKLEDQRQAMRDSEALALERGQRGAGSAADKIKVTLQEKDVEAPADTGVFEGQDDHLLVDGHKTKFATKTT